MKFVLTGLVLLLVLGATETAELTGTVRSKSGKPLTGVVVFSRGFKPSETDSEGRFKLRGADQRFPSDKQVVFFSGPGLRPVIKIIDGRAEQVHVELEESAGGEWLIPTCQANPGKRLGVDLRFPVLKGASVKKGRDVDYADFSISYGPKGERRRLYGINGPRATFGYPDDEWVLTAKEFTLRPWRNGDFEGVDVRGKSPDGKRWRYFGKFSEAVMYSDATEEDAAFLDRIIDGVCFAP